MRDAQALAVTTAKRFQSLKGILENCEQPEPIVKVKRRKFQSLKGILENCESDKPPQGGIAQRFVSIPQRDFRELREVPKEPPPLGDRFQSRKGILENCE